MISAGIAHNLSYAVIIISFSFIAVVFAIRRELLESTLINALSEINGGTHINFRLAANIIKYVVKRQLILN